MVEGATTALSRLLDDNEKFDVVMENMNSSDKSRGRPKVLQYAMHKGLITVCKYHLIYCNKKKKLYSFWEKWKTKKLLNS